MTLGIDRSPNTGQPPARQDYEAEYRRMLACQTVEDLRTIAQKWGIKLRDVHKDPIVEQLATQLSDPQAIRAHLLDLDDLGRQVLAYLHLVLAPGYGLAADNIVRGLVRKRERVSQPVEEGKLLHIGGSNAARSPFGEYRGAIQDQIATLSERSLLLPFKQNNAVYYALPSAVRACLSSQPGLFPAYTKDADTLHTHKRTIGSLIHSLFAVWNALAKGDPESQGPPRRQAAPPRQPIEDQWTALQGWNHVPSEIAVLSRVRDPRGRSASFRAERLSAATLNWAVTVPAPAHRLRDIDRQFLRERTGCSDQELEFYYTLLEGIGAAAGDAGEPIVTRKEAIQRFLRLSPATKMRTLWEAWETNDAWSEMDFVLRSAQDAEVNRRSQNAHHPDDVQHPMRLRRSLAYADYKTSDLYQEWRAGRQAVIRFLSLLEENRWVSVNEFLKTVFQVHPNLLHTHTDLSVWWLESLHTGRQFGTTFDDWRHSYGRFVVAVLEGPLNWLGMVRLGYRAAAGAAHGTLEAFQLTPAGAFALGRRPTLVEASSYDTAQAGPVCSIADDLTVTLVPGRAPLELHDLLHAVAKLLEATPERFVYRVTADKVFRWAESAPFGDSGTADEAAIEALIASLNKHCRAMDAQANASTPWQDTLRMWSRNYGQLHVYENVTTIELADDYALQELLVSTSLRKHLVYQFSPRLVAIEAEAVDILVQEMETRGYTPRVE